MKNYKEVTDNTLALAEECGKVPVSTINNIPAFIAEMKAEGWDCYMDETTDHMICEPEDLTGKAWKDLTEKQREDLLDTAEAINGTTGEFVGTAYSVLGRINEDGEIEIDDEAVIYCSRS